MHAEGDTLCMIYKDVRGRHKSKFRRVLLLCVIYNKLLTSMNLYLHLGK